jgi:hypothetical protein
MRKQLTLGDKTGKRGCDFVLFKQVKSDCRLQREKDDKLRIENT